MRPHSRWFQKLVLLQMLVLYLSLLMLDINIDKTIKPRHMTVDSHTTSLHYVHAYAVKDSVDFSHNRKGRGM